MDSREKGKPPKKQSWIFNTFLLSFGIMAALLLFSFLAVTAGFEPSYYSEQPLEKNAQFGLSAGEALAYNLTFPNGSTVMAFMAGKRQWNPSANAFGSCTPVWMPGLNSSTCINPDGRDGESNLTLKPMFFFFSPWMLALNDSFAWNGSIRSTFNGDPISVMEARVVGSEYVYGRDAYVVEINESGPLAGAPRKDWIDKERRVLLKEQGTGDSIEIVGAPFIIQGAQPE